MGLTLATQNATDGLAWAQCWPQSMLPMILHGPSPGHPACYLMVLCGPSTGHKACNRWSCMGPEQAEKYTTDDLTWAQHWPHSMQPMVLCGPSPWPQSVLLKVLYGPSAGP